MTRRAGPGPAAWAHDVGLMMIPAAAVALPTLAVALANAEWSAAVGLLVPVLAGGGGAVLARACRHARRGITPGHGSILAAAWLLATIVCAAPFVAGAVLADAPSETTRAFADPINALFESMSGLTSTGLTVATDPRELPLGLQWWRSTLQWLGGVGILYFALAAASIGGDTPDRGQGDAADDELGSGEDDQDGPPLRRVLLRTWLVYAVLSGASFLAYLLTGMSAWDAANHAQSAIATGGFSTSPDSLAAFGPAAQAVTVGTIVVGSISFLTLRTAILDAKPLALPRDSQARWLAGALVVGIAATWLLSPLGLWDATFQWTTALATAGFSTVKIGDLPPATLWLLAAAMLLGGAAGSTVGGLKLARLRRLALLVLRRRDAPDGLSESVGRTLGIAAAFALTFALGTPLLWLTAGQPPLTDAAFEAASALGTVGLSTGLSAPDLPATPRLILITLMYLGRLEFVMLLRVAAKTQPPPRHPAQPQ